MTVNPVKVCSNQTNKKHTKIRGVNHQNENGADRQEILSRCSEGKSREMPGVWFRKHPTECNHGRMLRYMRPVSYDCWAYIDLYRTHFGPPNQRSEAGAKV